MKHTRGGFTQVSAVAAVSQRTVARPRGATSRCPGHGSSRARIVRYSVCCRGAHVKHGAAASRKFLPWRPCRSAPSRGPAAQRRAARPRQRCVHDISPNGPRPPTCSPLERGGGLGRKFPRSQSSRSRIARHCTVRFGLIRLARWVAPRRPNAASTLQLATRACGCTQGSATAARSLRIGRAQLQTKRSCAASVPCRYATCSDCPARPRGRRTICVAKLAPTRPTCAGDISDAHSHGRRARGAARAPTNLNPCRRNPCVAARKAHNQSC